MSDFKKNTAVIGFTFGLVNATTGAAVTSGTTIGYYILDGGVQNTLSDTPVHEGNGQWSVNISAAEMNADMVGLIFINSSAIPESFTIRTVDKRVSDLNDIASTDIVTGPINVTSGAVDLVLDLANDEYPLSGSSISGGWLASGRITDIITKARDTLSDDAKERYSDVRLLRLIDEAQKDIAMKADLLRSHIEIAIIADQNVYTLPDEAFKVTRAIGSHGASVSTDTSIDRYRIPVKSHHQMDNLDPAWETTIGNGIEAIVFDKLDPTKLKIYPIPDTSDEVSDHTFTSDYGVVVLSTGDTFTSDYGIVVDISTSATLSATFSSDLGVVVDMASVLTSLLVYYNKVPAQIDNSGVIDTDVTLEIHYIFDKAIKHYIVGHALRDDQDAQNRSLGNEELMFYKEELAEALKQSARDFTDGHEINSDYREGNLVYNTGFDNGFRKNNY